MRIKPFRAVRPPVDLVQQVASPPYDVLNSDEARAMAKGNPLSFLHVVKPEIDLPANTDLYSDEVYQKARENFQAFREHGTLIQEEESCFYLYAQTMNGHTQYGLVVCCHIEDYENDVIKKHEHTRAQKEDDRTRRSRIPDVS